MSSTIDTKVVEMKFDNSQFESGVKQSMNTLDNLKQKLNKTNDGSSFDQLSKAASKTDLSGLTKSIDAVEKRFSIMGIAGMTVIQNITNSALSAAKTILTAVPNQIKNGGWSRAMNLENAKFQLEGLGITWDRVGKQINNAVAGTAFSLDAAANAASSLVASGIAVEGEGDELEKVLTAISGVAAQTNSEYSDIASIFTTVAGNGRLMSQQLQQLSYRGMNAAAVLAKQLGVTEAEVREMTSQGAIDFKTFSDAMMEAFGENAFKANQTFTGSLKNLKSALSKIGANFAEPIQQQAIPVFNALREAVNRAKNEVEKFAKFDLSGRESAKKSYAEAKNTLDAYRESMGAIGVKTASTANELKRLGDNVTAAKHALEATYSPFEKLVIVAQNFVTDYINNFDMSFLEDAFTGLTNAGKGLLSVLIPIKEAFKLVFPESLPETLQKLATGFKNLTNNMELSEEIARSIKSTFAGVFEVIKLVSNTLFEIVEAIFPALAVGSDSLLGTLIKGLGTISQYIIAISRVVGRMSLAEKGMLALKTAGVLVVGSVSAVIFVIEELGNALLKLEPISYVFDKIKTGLMSAYTTLKDVVKSFQNIFKANGVDLSKITCINDLIAQWPNILKSIEHGITALGNKFPAIKTLSTAVTFLVNKFKDLKEAIFPSKKDTKNSLITIADEQVPLAGAQVSGFTDTINKFSDAIKNFFQNISLTKVMAVAFAGVLIAIGTKIVYLIGSITNLNNKLAKLVNSPLKTILGIGTTKRATQGTILQIAESITLLAASLKLLSTIPGDQLWQTVGALGALSGMIIAMTFALNLAKKLFNEASLVKGKGADDLLHITAIIGVIAGSMVTMVLSLKLLESLNTEEIIPKLLSLAAIATIFGVLTRILGKTAGSKGFLTIIAAAASMKKLAEALGALSDVEVDGITQEKFLYLAEISAILGAVSIMCSKVSLFGFVALLGAMVVLKAIFPLLQQFSELPFDNFKDALMEMASSFGVFLVIGALVALVTAALSANKIAKFGFGMLALAGGIALIGKVAASIGAIRWQDLLKGSLVVGGVMVLLFMIVDGIGDLKASWKSILTLTLTITVLTGAIAAMSMLIVMLGALDKDTLIKGAGVVGGLMILITLFVGVSIAAQNVQMASIMGIVIAMGVILAEVMVMSLLMGPNLYASLVSMVLVFVALAGAITAIGTLGQSFSKEKLKAVIILVSSLGVIAVALGVLSHFDWLAMLLSAVSMSMVLLALAGSFAIIEKFGKGNATASGAMALMAVSLVVIAGALAMFTQLVSLAAVGEMALSLIVIAGALLILSKVGEGYELMMTSVAIGVVAIALATLAFALGTLNDVDWTTIAAVAGVIVVLSVALGVLAGIVVGTGGLFAVGLIAVAAAFAIFGASCLLMGAGVILAATGITLMTATLQTLITIDLATLATTLISFANSLYSIALSGILLAVGAVGFIAASAALLLFGTSFSIASVFISTGIIVISNAINTLFAVLNANKLQKAGNDATLGLSRGLLGGRGNVISAVTSVVSSFFDTFCKLTGWHSPWESTEDAGNDATIGLAKGMTNSGAVDKLKKAVTAICDAVKNSFSKLKDWIAQLWENIKAGNFELPSLSLGLENLWNTVKGAVGADSEGGFLSSIKDELAKVTEEMGATTDTSFDFDKILSDIDTSAYSASTSLGDTATATTDTGGAAGDASDKIKDLTTNLENVTTAATETKSAFEQLRESIENAIKPFDTFNTTTQVTSERLLEDMESQIEGVTNWSKMINELGGRGVSAKLLSYLSELGPSGYKYVQAFYDMTEEQLADANAKYTKILGLDEEAATTITEGFTKAGEWAAKGFKEGLNSETVQTVRDAGMMGTYVLDELKDVLEINSPSKKTEEIGKYIIEGLANGMENNMSIANEAANKLPKSILSNVEDAVSYTKSKDCGTVLGTGLAAGIVSKIKDVKESAKEITDSVGDLSGLKNLRTIALNMGRCFGEELAKGMLDTAGAIDDASSELSNTFIENMRTAVNNALSIINDDAEFRPIITPVLDLSEIQNGYRSMKNLLESGTTTVASASYIAGRMNTVPTVTTGSGPVTNSQSVVNNFNQYNTSPKTLSTTEIYRQTKNLFTMQKGALGTL